MAYDLLLLGWSLDSTSAGLPRCTLDHTLATMLTSIQSAKRSFTLIMQSGVNDWEIPQAPEAIARRAAHEAKDME